MEIEEYINQKIEQYQNLLEFIENESEDDGYIQEYINTLENLDIFEDKKELQLYLRFIVKIFDNHRRTPYFISKIESIIQNIFQQTKQTLSNFEIFQIFKSNKLILLILIKNNIININDDIASFILHQSEKKYKKYGSHCHFFYPEIIQFLDSKRKAKKEEGLLSMDENIFNNFEEKRQIGENDSFICSLIRNDSIEEFVTYVTKNNISLKSQIKYSIFETNSFLLDKSPSLIEYSAFFGSIQIFNYLRLNRVNFSPSLWLYAIHGQNADLIHLLEENHCLPEDKSYMECFEESIKCHHNDFANYFKVNFLMEKYKPEKAFELYFHYNNLSLPINEIEENLIYVFENACKFNYFNLVDLFINEDENDKFDIKKINFFFF